LLYLKPAQTGFPGDSDARLVGAAAGLPLAAGPHAAQLDASIPLASGPGGGSSPGSALAKTLYAWRQPISPHLAVETEGRPVSDRRLAADVAAELRAFAAAADSCGSSSDSRSSGSSFPTVPQLAVVETAGGVASPSPSGALQCEALRALSLPGLLVGDGRLGGISATLAAYDALVLRGHAVPLVALMEDGRLDNAKAIQRHLGSKARVLAFPMCPPPPEAAPPAAGGIDASLAAWLRDSRPQFDALLCATCDAHAARLAGLHAAADEARATLWWPFTQHASVAGVTVIDGRVGESFAVFRPGGAAPQGGQAGSSGKPAGQASAPPACEGSGRADGTSGTSEGARLELQYDSCASWWTQGVSSPASWDHP
jgi:dethiobiotin synthetase/adenosylmethionine--8-amino-7-oxononanoate aminotransferase